MQRQLRWFPVAWASGVYLTLLVLPVYRWVSSSQTSGGAEIRTAGRATLAEANGPWVYVMLAIPVVAAALAALPLPAEYRRPAAIVGASIASAFVVLGMMSVGIFFLPSAIGLIALAAAAKEAAKPTNS